jgi:hydroxymethylpyrimidine pyrophosphatase-like HAD family hydrolase
MTGQHGWTSDGSVGKAWRPRLVALDVDGTLPAWTEIETPTSEPAGSKILSALHAVLDAGTHIVLCSGRSPLGITRVVDRLRLLDRTGEPVWLVASNGAVLCRYAPLEIVLAETFDARPAVRALLEKYPSALVAVEHRDGYRLTAPFPDGELPGEMIVTDLDDLLAVTPPPRPTSSSGSSTKWTFRVWTPSSAGAPGSI